MPKTRVKQIQGSYMEAMAVNRKTGTYQLAFWGLAILLFSPPYFRGLFFATEQQIVLTLAAVLFWFVWLWKHSLKDYAFLSNPLDYFVLALPAAYIISCFNAVNYGLAVDEIVKNILYFLVYWMIVNLMLEEADIARLLHVVYLAAAGVALAGLATATGLINIKDGFLDGRIYSSFQYPNALASYLAATGFLGFFFWQKKQQTRVKDEITDRALQKILPNWLLKLKPYGYFYFAVNFILLAVLFGTKSRGGLFVTGLVFLLYIIVLAWQKRLPMLVHVLCTGGIGFLAVNKFIAAADAKQMGRAWLWILLGLVVVIIIQFAYNFAWERRLKHWKIKKAKSNWTVAGIFAAIIAACGVFAAIRPGLVQNVLSFNYLRNAFERFYFVQDALSMFKARPILGWGGGGWEEAYRSFQHYLYNSNEVHSYYFQVAVETGILGLLAVIGICAAFLWTAHCAYRKSLPDGNRRALILTMTAAALTIGGHALIDFDLSLSALTLLLWTLFACVRVIGSLPEQEETAEGNIIGLALHDRSGARENITLSSRKKKQRKSNEKPRLSKRNIRIPASNPVLFSVFSMVSIVIFLLGMALTSASTYASSASESLQSRNVQQGLKYMEKAAARNPLNAVYHTGLMQIYLGSSRIDQSLEEAKQAAVLSRYSAARKADLASVSLYAGKYEEAVNHAREAIELAPFQISWYENLAGICAAAGQGELIGGNKDTARKDLEEAIGVPLLIQKKVGTLNEEEKKLWRDGPMMFSTPKVLLYTGQSHYLLGNLTEADKELQSVLSDQQSKGEALVWLALVKEKQGKGQEAAQLIKQASDINKDYEKTYEQLKRLPVL